MFLISLGDIRLPFVSTGLVDVKIELSNPEEDIHLGKHRYCRVLDGPSLQAQLIIPDSGVHLCVCVEGGGAGRCD